MDFSNIYTKYYRTIYNLSFRILGNSELAKDITQETFEKLYNSVVSKKGIDNLKSWLYRVTVNNCTNLIKRSNHLEEIFKNNILKTEIEESTEENLINSEKQNIIRKAINQLPERDKNLIMLYLDDLSYSEMAEILDMKKNSIGKSLSRAIDKLKENLKTTNYELFN